MTSARPADRLATPALIRLWCGVLAFFLSFFLLLPTVPLYARALGVPESQVGLLVGAFPIAAMLLRPVAGWAADRHGRRPLMLGGAALFTIAPGLYAAGTSLMSLLATRLVHGCGMGLYQTAGQAMVTDMAPPGRRGEAVAVVGMAGSVALAVGPLLGLWIVERWGFGGLFAVSGATAAGALALTAAQPESLPEPTTVRLGLRTLLSRAVLYPCLVEVMMMAAYGLVITFLPLAAADSGGNAGIFFLVMAGAVIAARGYSGRAADRWGRAPVAALGAALQTAALAMLAAGSGGTMLAAAGALYGLGFGTTGPALVAWCADLVGSRERGTAMGTFYTALELGIAVGAMGAGPVAQRLGYAATFLLGAAAALVGCALALARVRPRNRAG